MQNRYRLYRRGKIFCTEDTRNRSQKSLRVTDRTVAERLVLAMNEAAQNPHLHLQLARAYLTAADPRMVTRTWRDVANELATHGREATQARYARAFKGRDFARLLAKRLVETTSDDLLALLASPVRCTRHFLRVAHHRALQLGWLPGPVLPAAAWPVVRWSEHRGITRAEFTRILAAEASIERRRYYKFLWLTGCAQTDGALMTAEHVDWQQRVLTYHRKKLEVGSPPARLGVGVQLETLLRELPATGLLFPGIARLSSSDRAAEFRRRCRLLGITGISLHSFRYGFAERAFEAGLSERFAQAALGHSSKAVHRHYAKGAATVCPPLEDPVPSAPTPAPPNVTPFPGLPAPGIAASGKWGAA